MWLSSREIVHLQSVVSARLNPELRFYVNGTSKLVPIRNGSALVHDYLIVVDPDDFRFAVHHLRMMEVTEGHLARGRPGLRLQITFSLRFERLPAEPESANRHPIPLEYSFTSFFLFLPTFLLFLFQRSDVPIVSRLNDMQTLPDMAVNAVFLTCAGFFELVRLILFAMFFNGSEANFTVFNHVAIFAAFAGIFLRIWLHFRLGDSFSHAEFAAPVLVSYYLLVLIPNAFGSASRFLFGSFRGRDLMDAVPRAGSFLLALFLAGFGFGKALLQFLPRPKDIWFKRGVAPTPTKLPLFG
jgi:hypothetical protein